MRCPIRFHFKLRRQKGLKNLPPGNYTVEIDKAVKHRDGTSTIYLKNVQPKEE